PVNRVRDPLGLESEPWVDRLRLQRQDREDAFMHAPERFAATDAVERFEPEGVLTAGHRALVAEPALAQPLDVGGFGVVGAVDDAQVFTPANLEARLHQTASAACEVGRRLDDHALSAA